MSSETVVLLVLYGLAIGILVLIYLQERHHTGLERKLREIVKEWKAGQQEAAKLHRKWYQRFFSRHN